MVKLTEEQKRELDALRNMPDEEIDFSDIPERPIDWSKAKIAPFYRPIWRDFSLKLDQFALDCLENGLADGQTLDEGVNKALRAQMFRIRFPVRVQKAEKTIRRIQESPAEVEDLFESQKQQIEILYAVPIAEVASHASPLKPIDWPKNQVSPQNRPVIKDMTLKLDENIIDWYEYGLEDGQSLDEVLNKALMDHIHWVSSPRGGQREDTPVGRAGDSK